MYRMKDQLILLIILSGCLGGEHTTSSRDLVAIALNREDLGTGSWTVTTSNLSEDVYEVRFVRLESSFGAESRLANRIHLYPDVQGAMGDYRKLVESLSDLQTSSPNVGEAAVLWINDKSGYLAFVRSDIIVEFEYSASGVIETEFLVENAKIVDSRIKVES